MANDEICRANRASAAEAPVRTWGYVIPPQLGMSGKNVWHFNFLRIIRRNSEQSAKGKCYNRTNECNEL